MNQHMYLDLLKEKLVPWIDETFPESGITLYQDETTSHTANRAQKWCKRYMAGFYLKDLWPPLTSDLCHMDFPIWSILESKTSSSNHPNIGALKTS